MSYQCPQLDETVHGLLVSVLILRERVLFAISSVPHSLHFCAFFFFFFFGVISLFKTAPSITFSVPQHKKPCGMCLAEKIWVFHKLRSGMSYRGVGSEFSVNGST